MQQARESEVFFFPVLVGATSRCVALPVSFFFIWVDMRSCNAGARQGMGKAASSDLRSPFCAPSLSLVCFRMSLGVVSSRFAVQVSLPVFRTLWRIRRERGSLAALTEVGSTALFLPTFLRLHSLRVVLRSSQLCYDSSRPCVLSVSSTSLTLRA